MSIKNKKTIIILILSIIALSSYAISMAMRDQLPVNVSQSFKNGDAQLLSQLFMNRVELAIDGKEDTYLKNEAKDVLHEFFITHISTDFYIIHDGGKDSFRYFIGILTTYKGKYRVYLLLKAVNTDNYLIQQVRIDQSNE
jgi:hypothetical protein